jgi:hypothetical protein
MHACREDVEPSEMHPQTPGRLQAAGSQPRWCSAAHLPLVASFAAFCHARPTLPVVRLSCTTPADLPLPVLRSSSLSAAVSARIQQEAVGMMSIAGSESMHLC